MPQISLYIDSDTLKKVQKQADQEGASLSSFVKKSLIQTLHGSRWPENYFELFGALKSDKGFEVPKEIPSKWNRKREKF